MCNKGNHNKCAEGDRIRLLTSIIHENRPNKRSICNSLSSYGNQRSQYGFCLMFFLFSCINGWLQVLFINLRTQARLGVFLPNKGCSCSILRYQSISGCLPGERNHLLDESTYGIFHHIFRIHFIFVVKINFKILLTTNMVFQTTTNNSLCKQVCLFVYYK